MMRPSWWKWRSDAWLSGSMFPVWRRVIEAVKGPVSVKGRQRRGALAPLGMDTRARWWDDRFLYERFNCKPILIPGIVRGSRYRGRGCLGCGGRRICGAGDVG